jgi:hypothetical protein
MEDLVQQTEMNWQDPGPKLIPDDLSRFERKIGRSLAPDLRWLLVEVANGGLPPQTRLPVPELGPSEGVVAQGLYGIGHPDESYSMDVAWEDLHEYGTARGFPIGYDQGGWQFVIVESGPLKNQIRLIPWDEYCDPTSNVSYLVAPNMRDFVALLNGIAK